MIQETISPERARRFYDRIGRRYDWFDRFESRAKRRAVDLLDAAPGLRVLNAGVGTGREHLDISEGVHPEGMAVGLDLSPVMARLAFARTATPIVIADTGQLPFSGKCYDRIYAAYILDLVATRDIPQVLSEYRRVLKPAGRLVTVTLTDGRDRTSRGLMAAWRWFYQLAPDLCGGCRPLRIRDWILQAGFTIISQEVHIQAGMPSEITVAVAQGVRENF